MNCHRAWLGSVLTAVLSVGAAPHAMTASNVTPLSVSGTGAAGLRLLSPEATGMTFTNALSDDAAAANQIRLNGSGVALGDVDGDGRCDVYLCGLESSNALFLNRGGWTFERAENSPAIACAGQFSSGAALVDLDGDGDLDLLVNGVGTGTRLFVNDGTGRFDERMDAGFFRRGGTTSFALADVDGDGDLDVYVVVYRTTTIRTTGLSLLNENGRRQVPAEQRHLIEITPEGRVLEHGEPDILYRNEGGGRFAPVPWTSGAFRDENGEPLPGAPYEWGLSAMFRDINRDGAPDLYVCNDFHSPDRFWLNDGRGGFQAMSALAVRHTPTFSMAVDFADFDRDGHDDFFVADMLSRSSARRLMQLAGGDPYASAVGVFDDRPQFDRNALQWNRGDGSFAEIAQYAGVEASEWTWAVAAIDVDLDGFEDLLCTTGHMFDTQDLDAGARIEAAGPWPRAEVPRKLLMHDRMPLPRQAYRNRGDRTFVPSGAAWGFDQVGVAHGMALGDLDGDGDLDVVVNNLNGAAGVYRNESPAPRLMVRLKGQPPNTRGIGARIQATPKTTGRGAVKQEQEMIAGGRYLSSDDAIRMFAATGSDRWDISVRWRSGKVTQLKGVPANSVVDVDEQESMAAPAPPPPRAPRWFEEDWRSLNHAHQDEPFDDFARAPGLPAKLSQSGPGVAWFDADGDGREDISIGAGRGDRWRWWRNATNGFVEVTRTANPGPLRQDLVAVVGFHLAATKPVWLAGVSDFEAIGGDLAGQFFDATNGLPSWDTASSPVAVSDVDADGDLDVFVGGRPKPAQWPSAVDSRLWRNEGGKLVPDASRPSFLAGVGMVHGATFTDLDGDGFAELVLACEWGALRIFRNDHGRLQEWIPEVTPADGSQATKLSDWTGLWTGVSAADFDGDGRMDFIAGNWGWNTGWLSAADQGTKPGDLGPELVVGDFDGDGQRDVIEAWHEPGTRRLVPVRDRDAAMAAMPGLAARFSSYAAFNAATVQDIAGAAWASAKRWPARWLATTVFLNRGTRFEALPLPPEAQLSPTFGVTAGDFDGDGAVDIFLAQNFFPRQPKAGRLDAGRGLLLRGNGRGNFSPVPAAESGIAVYGEQRGTASADFDLDGRLDLVVTENGAATRLFRNARARAGLRLRLHDGADNPTGVGASVRWITSEGPAPRHEIHAGGGYGSQDGATQILARPYGATECEVRWPGGQISRHSIEPGIATIQLTRPPRPSSKP
jgi:enediyne biosynthesis protein E4